MPCAKCSKQNVPPFSTLSLSVDTFLFIVSPFLSHLNDKRWQCRTFVRISTSNQCLSETIFWYFVRAHSTLAKYDVFHSLSLLNDKYYRSFPYFPVFHFLSIFLCSLSLHLVLIRSLSLSFTLYRSLQALHTLQTELRISMDVNNFLASLHELWILCSSKI